MSVVLISQWERLALKNDILIFCRQLISEGKVVEEISYTFLRKSQKKKKSLTKLK